MGGAILTVVFPRKEVGGIWLKQLRSARLVGDCSVPRGDVGYQDEVDLDGLSRMASDANGHNQATVPSEDIEARKEEELLAQFPATLSADVFLKQQVLSTPAGSSGVAEKGKAPMPDLDIPAEFVAEDAQARKRFEEEQASERLDLDDLMMRMTETDWLNLMMQVGSNPALARELLGADVTEANFIERMTAIKERKKRALADLRYRALKGKPLKQSEVTNDDGNWLKSVVVVALTCWNGYSSDGSAVLDTAGGTLGILVLLLLFPLLQQKILLLHMRVFMLFFLDSDEDELGVSMFWCWCCGCGTNSQMIDECDPRGKVEPISNLPLLLLGSRSKHRGVRSDTSLWDRPVDDFLSSGLVGDYIQELLFMYWTLTKWGETVYMFVDKFYPIRAPLLERMLRHRLTVPPSYCRDVVVAGSVIQTIQDGLRESYECLASAPIVDMVINPPWNLPFLGAKGLTSPEQTATGKGISNPLMAVMLMLRDVAASFDSAVHRVHAVSFDAAVASIVSAACCAAADYVVYCCCLLCSCCSSILLPQEDLSRNLELTESTPIVPADSLNSIPADYVSAGHVLVPADSDRIC
ncbi:hypothetical protein Tco_0179784 [Tanacetum coccineum]